MTDVIIAPRIEDPLSDVEAVINGGYFQVRASRWNATSGQWISDAWPAPVPLTGVAVTAKLDPSTVPYELYVNYPDGRGGFAERTEFRTVVASGSPVKWEDLVPVSGPGGDSAPSSDLAARVTALELALTGVSGGASTLSGISDMTAPARTLNAQSSYTSMRTTLGLGSVDNTADVDKPTSTAQATVNALKADKAGATFTGPINGTSASFSSTVTVATATASTHAVTKAQLDAIAGVSGSVDPVNSNIVILTVA